MKTDIEICVLKWSLSFSSVTQSLLIKAQTMYVPVLDFTHIFGGAFGCFHDLLIWEILEMALCEKSTTVTC